MKVAFIADWLTVFAGAEHALADMMTLWPDAVLFTTVAKRGALGPLDQRDIRTSRLQKIYQLIGKHQVLLPFMPRALEEIDLTGFDVVISSSHAVAKGIIPPSTAVHICYCHTPMRYAWEMESEYLRDFGVPGFLMGSVKKILKKIRRWDLSTSKRVDQFIANSTETERRIRETYGRESIIIPPPVAKEFFTTPLVKPQEREGFLSVGRLVPYKRLDLLVQAANTGKFSLTIAGKGREEQRLKAMAGPTVRFLGHVSDDDLPALYAHAKAVLFAAHEDAGIVPLEAQASGTPVIAYGKGGVLDNVVEGKTGVFFQEQSVESLLEAIKKSAGVTFDPEYIRSHAMQFSAEGFRKRVRELVEHCYTTR